TWALVALSETTDQQIGGRAPGLLPEGGDRGQRGLREGRTEDVIAADHAHVPGHGDPPTLETGQRADGERVVEEDRRRGTAELHDIGRGRSGGHRGEETTDGGQGDAVPLGGRAENAQPLLVRPGSFRAAYVGDRGVPQGDQVVQPLSASHRGIDDDAGEPLDFAVDGDDGDVRRDLLQV